jgi:O-acetyl-ADP-ribose deacetylase (regulator of RNase III)
MKIQYVVGDMFDTDARMIAHGCNAQGVMGSGVAASIRRLFPEAHKDYMEIYNTLGLRLGEVYITPIEGGAGYIANMITQEFYGGGRRYVSYDAIVDAFERLDEECIDLSIDRVALPQIGAGLGGGDWKIIEAIIEQTLKYTQPIVYLLEPLGDVK